jgi:hypothetical protein
MSQEILTLHIHREVQINFLADHLPVLFSWDDVEGVLLSSPLWKGIFLTAASISG